MTHLTKNLIKTISALTMLFIIATITADEPIATLRGDVALNTEVNPPKTMHVDNNDKKKQRNYTSQPPVIPHSIERYRIDLNSNKCLTCHARSRTAESGAPMISVTHFMDREGQFKATVSPRRYFCTQCHVSQLEIKPLVENEFIDIDALLAADKKK